MAKYGNEGVDDYLKQFGLNKNLYQKVLEDSFYQQNLMEALTQDVDEAAARTEESAFTSNVQQLISQAKKEKFDGIIEGWKNEAKIEKNEKEYNKIQIPNNNN